MAASEGSEPQDSLLRTRAQAEAAFQEYIRRSRHGEAPGTVELLRGLDADAQREFRQILLDYNELSGALLSGPASSGQFVSGQRIGPFTILREIGRGGTSIVYEAEQEVPRRRVALKILHSHLGNSAKALVRFRNEAQALARLRHPGVVAVHATGEHQGRHWIAEELVPGARSLAEQIREWRERGALPPEHPRQMATLFLQAAQALQAAHASGVLHRDLKPANLLVNDLGQLKLIDFGLARIEDELPLTRTGELSGTPFYFSPESLSSSKSLDARSDEFSLGVSFYEALTLERPFGGESLQQILRSIEWEDPIPPRSHRRQIPRDLEVIVLKMLEKRPQRRYHSLREVESDLRRFLDHQPIEARPVGWLGNSWRWARRHPAQATAVAGSSLIALALLLLLRSNQELRIEQERVGAVNAELLRALESGDPWSERGEGTLDQAQRLIRRSEELAGNSREALLLHTLGSQLLLSSGAFEQAERELREIERGVRAQGDPALDLEWLGVVLRVAEERDEALRTESAMAQTASLLERHPELDPEGHWAESLQTRRLLFELEEERPASPEAQAKALAWLEQRLQRQLERANNKPARLRAYVELGRAARAAHDHRRAHGAWMQALTLAREHYGQDSRRSIEVALLLLETSGREAEGDAWVRSVVRTAELGSAGRQRLGERDPLRARMQWRLALENFDQQSGMAAFDPSWQAELQARRAELEQLLGAMHRLVLQARVEHSTRILGRLPPEAALAMLEETQALLLARYPAGHSLRWKHQALLAQAQWRNGQREAGCRTAVQMLEGIEQREPWTEALMEEGTRLCWGLYFAGESSAAGWHAHALSRGLPKGAWVSVHRRRLEQVWELHALQCVLGQTPLDERLWSEVRLRIGERGEWTATLIEAWRAGGRAPLEAVVAEQPDSARAALALAKVLKDAGDEPGARSASVGVSEADPLLWALESDSPAPHR